MGVFKCAVCGGIDFIYNRPSNYLAVGLCKECAIEMCQRLHRDWLAEKYDRLYRENHQTTWRTEP